MNEQILVNRNGNPINATGIAYFQVISRNKSYVLYSLGELVENDREKMYVGEVVSDPFSQSKIEKEEWDYLNEQLRLINFGQPTPDLKFMTMAGITFNVCEPKKLAISEANKQAFEERQRTQTITIQGAGVIPETPALEEVAAFTPSAEVPASDVNIFQTPMQPSVESIAPASPVPSTESLASPDLNMVDSQIDSEEQKDLKTLSDEEITSQLESIKEAAEKIILQCENLKLTILNKEKVEEVPSTENSFEPVQMDSTIVDATPTALATPADKVVNEPSDYIYTGAENLTSSTIPDVQNVPQIDAMPKGDPMPESFTAQPEMNVVATDGNLYQVSSTPAEEAPAYTASGSISTVQPPEVSAVSEEPPVVMPDAYANVQNMNQMGMTGMETPSTLSAENPQVYSMSLPS